MVKATGKRTRAVTAADALKTMERTAEERILETLDADERHRMISEAAYELYMQRGYCDGYDLDDWLQAEAQVDHWLLSAEKERAFRGGERSTG
jgi:hypothetical protein